ncbi:hypothetical protein [Haliangium sp.]|uniref:hypothetical protein n=1 Tax=Haliangium sp. TaxID=2663208 RepID=UPI003D148878
MSKKIILTILVCFVLGAGVLQASANDAATDLDTTAALTVQAEDLVCEADFDIILDEEIVAEAGTAYECKNKKYCRQDDDCDASNGEVCSFGCCLSAF